LLSGSSSSPSSTSATISSFSVAGAEGEADCSIPSEDESDELLEVELESSEGDGARLAGRFTNRGHDADIAVIVAIFLLWAEGDEQRPGGLPPGSRRRCSRAQRHGGDHVLDEACLNVDDPCPLG
jgi:hypothetical protein